MDNIFILTFLCVISLKILSTIIKFLYFIITFIKDRSIKYKITQENSHTLKAVNILFNKNFVIVKGNSPVREFYYLREENENIVYSPSFPEIEHCKAFIEGMIVQAHNQLNFSEIINLTYYNDLMKSLMRKNGKRTSNRKTIDRNAN